MPGKERAHRNGPDNWYGRVQGLVCLECCHGRVAIWPDPRGSTPLANFGLSERAS